MLQGIDISHYQRGINLENVNCDFVICKATEGVGYTDPLCNQFYQTAKRLGRKLGVYHFARPDLGNSAVEEADWFLSQVQGYIKEAMLILDWERQTDNVAWAKAWLDRVYEQTGVKPVIYMSAYPANSYNWQSVVDGNYGLWIASYGANTGSPGVPPQNRYWPFYCMWQYTSRGRLNGYNGNLDLDIFYGSRTSWDKYATGDGNVSPENPGDGGIIADQVLYPGSKVQFYGCQIDDIRTRGNYTEFYSKKYGTWLPITPFYRVGADGERYPNQKSSKGNWLKSDAIFTVKSVSKNPDRAVITIGGVNYNVLSSGLYELSDR